MTSGEIIGIVIAAIMLIIALLTWLGVMPRKFGASKQVKGVPKFDMLGIALVLVIVAVIYLSAAGKEIPPAIYALIGGIFFLLFMRWAGEG